MFFSDGSAELGARGRIALEAQAAWLERYPNLAVTIEGHADDAGAVGHNLEVSPRRAEAVRRRLIQIGVAPERIRTVAYGRERLIADAPTRLRGPEPACRDGGGGSRRLIPPRTGRPKIPPPAVASPPH